MRRAALTILLGLLAAPPAFAQIGFPGHRKPSSTRVEQVPAGPEKVEFTGVVDEVKDGTITIETADHRFITAKITSKTAFTRPGQEWKREDAEAGDHVRIQGLQDQQFEITANSVEWLQPPPGESNPNYIELGGRKAPAAGSEDPDRPRLTRGIPARKAKAEEPEEAPEPRPTLREGASAMRPPSGDPLIEKARQASDEFTESLPNFQVQQYTARFLSPDSGKTWQAQDVVSADVLWVKGHEDYRNIKINDKLVGKDMMDIPGARSTGEFGTVMRMVLDPNVQARFTRVRDTSIAGQPATMYSFSVARENSRWRVIQGAQFVVPAYSGRIWIEKSSGRLLRIEKQAEGISKEFPLDTVESVIEYGPVRLGGDSFLLPVTATNLSCVRGERLCDKEELSFRNYHLFKGESTITFDTADEPAPKKPKP